MHARIFSATTVGIDSQLIEVEVDVSLGLVNFFIVGLPDTAVKESSKRIQTALKNAGIRLPAKRITVNLAPADVKKIGTLFDLPIAVGILCATGHIDYNKSMLRETLIIGELSLDGHVRPVRGALSVALDAHKTGKKRLIVPKENAVEAACAPGVEVIGVTHITELIEYLGGHKQLSPELPRPLNSYAHTQNNVLDFAQVTGQKQAKYALAIAAAGGHNILFVGPPGSGKTMLAKRLITILPHMSDAEILSTSKVYSVSGKLSAQELVATRPFRAPHHTISQAGLIGGGSIPQPGEISLAHNGVLFLDELTEFKRATIEALRQPLETSEIVVSRVQQSVTFPARFVLVAALNPCPCGYWGDTRKNCSCSPHQVNTYFGKISGPLLDRIDLQVGIQSVPFEQLNADAEKPISSAQLRNLIAPAITAQYKRFNSTQKTNASMNTTEIQQFCTLTPAAQALAKKAFTSLHLSMRGYHKALRVARTIADMNQSFTIDEAHIRSALMHRSLEQHLERITR